jgi:4-hydroxy-3-methylbut-2-enyl diphosphate reductase
VNKKLPTYFISSEREIESATRIHHFDFKNQKHLSSENFIPSKSPVTIILTSGASCPDSVVDAVLQKILTFFEDVQSSEIVLDKLHLPIL